MVRQLLLIVPLLTAGEQLGLEWLDCCFQNRTICNEAAGFCRSLAHFVVAAETEYDAVLRGGVEVSVDSGPYVAGTSMVREMKPAPGRFGHPNSQSINYGYDAIAEYKEEPQGLPTEVCAAAWVSDVGTGARGETPPHCLALSVEHLSSQGDVTEVMPSYFDAEHSQAVVVTGHGVKRLLVHADARVATPNLVDTMTGTALCTLEGGTGSMTSCGTVMFEQQIVPTMLNGTQYLTQVFQFVHDLPVEEVPKQVCFKLGFKVTDFPSSPLSWLAATGELRGTEDSLNCMIVQTLEANKALV